MKTFTMDRRWAESITNRMMIELKDPCPLVGRYNAVSELQNSIENLVWSLQQHEKDYKEFIGEK